jgi:predicted SprT family Zn-dependent metalloprotease
MAAVYDCLRAFPPFAGWNLPTSSEIAFKVTLSQDTFGTFELRCEKPHIEISTLIVTNWHMLVETMAHEMIHLRQCRMGRAVDHDVEWQKLATRVCREFGWQRQGF